MNLPSVFQAVQSQPKANSIHTIVSELERQGYEVFVNQQDRALPPFLPTDKHGERYHFTPPQATLIELKRKNITESFHLHVLKRHSAVVNSGSATNFIFRFVGPDVDRIDLQKINRIYESSPIAKRMASLRKLGAEPKFFDIQGAIFRRNLELIDSRLPEILAWMLLYAYRREAKSNLPALLEKLNADNPLGYDLSSDHPFYGYKIKRFLVDAALGMTPAEIWKGAFDGTGGIIIIIQDGNVMCYHIYNFNEFEDYLLNNTRLEQASIPRYHFGNLYREKEGLFIKLNLQIRFT